MIIIIIIIIICALLEGGLDHGDQVGEVEERPNGLG